MAASNSLIQGIAYVKNLKMKFLKYITKTKISVTDKYIGNYKTENFCAKRKFTECLQKLGFQVTPYTRKHH